MSKQLTRQHHVGVRFNDEEFEKLTALSYKLGTTPSGTLRFLVDRCTDGLVLFQTKIEKNLEKMFEDIYANSSAEVQQRINLKNG